MVITRGITLGNDASELKEYIVGMFFLKRASDVFEARWPHTATSA